VLNDVHVDAWAKPIREMLAARARDDLVNAEVGTVWILAVQERGGNPDLVGHLDRVLCSRAHC
jgi:hypothetical protein